MKDYYAVYSLVDGAFSWKTTGPEGSAAAERVPDGFAVIEMPYAAFVALPGDLGPLKSAVVDMVNTKAGDFRKLHITDIPGQQATYLEKAKDAEAWIAAGKPTDLTPYPYLQNESQQTGRTADAVATEIVTTAQLWRIADARIEGKRQGAKVQIMAAANIKDIVTPAMFDWATLVADLLPATPQP